MAKNAEIDKIMKSKDPRVLTVTAGMDIGNGDSKCKVKFGKDDPETFSLPSVVAYTTGSNTPKQPTDEYMDNLYTNLDAEVTGPGIKSIDEGRMLFGKRAINFGQSLTMFNITNHVPKSHDSLSTILLDGILASRGVMHYYKKQGKLPDQLDILAGVGTALPIGDYLEYRDSYKQALLSGIHTVTVRNFSEPIIVKIKYQSCVVMAEGAAAQYAIMKLGPDFIQKAIDAARKHGAKIDPGYTGEMLAKARNSLGIDLGDGTVNFAVITNNAINVEASSSINKSYGTILDEAVTDLANTTASFNNRRDLSDFMRDPLNKVMPAQKATYVQAQRAIDAHKEILVRDIRTAFTDVFRKVGRRTQVIWVYGGGATPMQKTLEPVLIEEATAGAGQNIPILWMDSEYSRNLNRNGLFDAAVYGVKASLQ